MSFEFKNYRTQPKFYESDNSNNGSSSDDDDDDDFYGIFQGVR